MVELMRHAMEVRGHTFTYKQRPWSRALQETRKGLHNAIIAIAVTESKDLIYDETMPMAVTNMTFYTRTDSDFYFPDENKEELAKSFLANKRLVLEQSFGYNHITEYVRSRKDFIWLSGSNILARSTRMVSIGRADALLDSSAVVDYWLATEGKEFRSIIKKAGDLIEEHKRPKQYIGFSQRRANSHFLQEELRKGLHIIRENGTYERILKSYDQPVTAIDF